MEIINIEKETFDLLVNQIKLLGEQVNHLQSSRTKNSLNNWLDNQDVCMMLNISLRTLQSYRDTGKIAFSQINHKIYYKTEDVEKMLKENYISGNNKM